MGACTLNLGLILKEDFYFTIRKNTFGYLDYSIEGANAQFRVDSGLVINCSYEKLQYTKATRNVSYWI